MSEKVAYGLIYLTTRLFRGVPVKKYVGQHKYRNGKPDPYYLGSGTALRSAIKKYGRECFHRETLQECYSLEELNAAEIRWIEIFNAVEDPSFYNIYPGGSGYTKVKRKDLRKKVYQYNLDGSFVAEHESIEAASVVADCAEAQMTQCCKSDFRTAKGFIWRFEYKESYPPLNEGVDRPVFCYDELGNFVKGFDSVTEGAKFIGEYRCGNISACANNKKRSAGGFQWRYEKFPKIKPLPKKKVTNKPILQINPTTGQVLAEFESATEASRKTNLSQANISRSIKTGYLCAGYLWKFKNSEDDPINKRNSLKGRCRKVHCFTKTGEFVREFESCEAAGKFHGVLRGNIINVCAGRQAYSAGYFWRYAT